MFQRAGQIFGALGELVVDAQTRRKASAVVTDELADSRIASISRGVRKAGGGLQGRLQNGWARAQKSWEEQRLYWERQRLQTSIQEKKSTPVDVQVGTQLWTEAPQELRSRLWLALLQQPALGFLLSDQQIATISWRTAPKQAPSSPAPPRSTSAADPKADSAPEGSGTPKAAEAAPSSTRVAESPPGGSKGVEAAVSSTRGAESSNGSASAASTPTGSPKRPARAHSPVYMPSPFGDAFNYVEAEDPLLPGSQDTWQMVTDSSSIFAGSGSRLFPEGHPFLAPSEADGAPSPTAGLRQAMAEVAWPLKTEYAEDGKYNTLLQISVGQEEVDDVIERDIHRTFPEHPQFGCQAGQQMLFRVLKAYSLHDLEVGYCQGMAFVAGVLLMSVPEEASWQLLVNLMAEETVGMRDLYRPGLTGLKRALRMFEWLLARLAPPLKAHLEEYGVVPVLYASTWLLTAFACPFPPAFSGRVIDVMLTEGRTHVLLRAALAVMLSCAEDLLALDDFEALITHLKVSPLKWSSARYRSVLDQALQDTVSDELIHEASSAIEEGFQGSLARRTSSMGGAAALRAMAAVQRLTEDSSAGTTPPCTPSHPPREDSRATTSDQVDVRPCESEDAAELLLALDVMLPGGEGQDAHALLSEADVSRHLNRQRGDGAALS